MLSQHSSIRDIKESADLVKTKFGDVVCVGADFPEQREEGIIVYADRQDSAFGTRLIAFRKSAKEIEVRAYISGSVGVIRGTNVETYTENDAKFSLYDKLLREKGR